MWETSSLDSDEFTFPIDLTIETKFVEWLPALASVLMDHRNTEVREWRQDVVEGANLIAAWMEEHTLITGCTSDFVVLGQLKKVYAEDSRSQAPSNFQKMAKGYLCGHAGITFRDKTNINHVSTRGVVYGVKRRSSEVPCLFD